MEFAGNALALGKERRAKIHHSRIKDPNYFGRDFLGRKIALQTLPRAFNAPIKLRASVIWSQAILADFWQTTLALESIHTA